MAFEVVTDGNGLPVKIVADPLVVTSIVNNPDYTMTLTFSDGSVHQTSAVRGAIGASIHVDSVTFNPAGEMTIEFSDGTVELSPSLKGQDGRNIHHIIHDSSQLPDGTIVKGITRGDGLEDEVVSGVAGNKDTYIAYADQEELSHVGEITLQNGDSAYVFAVEGGFTGTLEEFIAVLGMIDDIVATANNAVADAELARDKAQQWATELEDAEVEPGEYSSLHWAAKAKTDTLNALAIADLKVNITDIVDDLISVNADKPLSANQGKVLKAMVDNINLLIASDDTTLDELQEVVNFIKANRTDLDALTLDNIAETATNKWFTVDEKTKLVAIEDGATADQTAAEIETLYEGLADTNKYTDSEKAQLVTNTNGVLSNAQSIANLATAQASISNASSTVATTTAQTIDIVTDTQSTDVDVFTVDDVANTITFKTNASINFYTAMTFTSSTNITRTVTVNVVDTSDETILKTFDVILSTGNGDTETVAPTFLLTVGRNGVPSADLTTRFDIVADDTGYSLDSFNVVIASSSSYDVSTDHGGLTGLDTTGSHPAAAISTTANGNVSNSSVQLVLEEIMNGSNPEEI